MQESKLEKISAHEYLSLERNSQTKNEYFDGKIYAMSGASRKHNLLVSNLITTLNIQLKNKPCRVYASDLRVKVAKNGLYTYPDVTISCEKEIMEDNHKDTLLNPNVLIEVLSDSTEKYDRGTKFSMYRKLESLKEYILVNQEIPKIEIYSKNEFGFWYLRETTDEINHLKIDSIDCLLTLEEVYNKVEDSE